MVLLVLFVLINGQLSVLSVVHVTALGRDYCAGDVEQETDRSLQPRL
jgi:hypothetical protein